MKADALCSVLRTAATMPLAVLLKDMLVTHYVPRPEEAAAGVSRWFAGCSLAFQDVEKQQDDFKKCSTSTVCRDRVYPDRPQRRLESGVFSDSCKR